MKFEKSKGESISKNKRVRVKKMNHIVEVVSIERSTNGLNKIQKLSKYEYMNLDSGEVLEYNLSENRGQNIAGLKDTFRKIRDLINNNFTGKGNEIHLTLTYKENMTDTKRLYKDFERFWKRYQYRYGKENDYLVVVEPQGRGAWHCHVLIKQNNVKNLYIPPAEMASLWGQGFIKIRSLDGVDNIGAYLSAYLGDVELNEESIVDAITNKREIKEVKIDGQTKRFVKGGRLHLYPPGMNLYRHSKGIVFPEIQEMKYQEIKKIVGSRIPNYSRTVTISDSETDKVLNRITYENYNMKRKGGQ